MQFYRIRKKNLFETLSHQHFFSSNTINKNFFFIQKITKPITKNIIRPTNYIYFFGYFSVLIAISFQGLSQSTGLIPLLNNSSLTYQLKSLRKLRKQKRIFHKKKWVYGTNLPINQTICHNHLLIKDKEWGRPKNYRKTPEFIKNKYVLIPAQRTYLENFIHYSLHSPQRYFSTQLITIHGAKRFFGDEIISIIYPPLHPRILRLYLKDKAIELQTDKRTLTKLTMSSEKLFSLFFLSANNRFYFLTILNIWGLLCFCIFIQQVIESFCFTLLNDGEQKPLLDNDPFGDYLLPSNLILPQNNTKNFSEGVQTGIATYELKTLIKNLQTYEKFSFQPWLKFIPFLSKKISRTTGTIEPLNSIPKGIVFVGNFDNGGIHFAQALAGEAKIPFVRIPATQFLLTNIHEGLLVMRIVFYYTKTIAPAILHIEDIDTFCGVRNFLGNLKKDRKSSIFSVEYDVSTTQSRNHINKVQKCQHEQTFRKAFQKFENQKIKTYNNFISLSLEQIFSYITKPGKKNNCINQIANSEVDQSSVSEDDLISLLNQLLIELDGLVSEKSQGKLVTTTTAKNLKALEPALIRPGRLSTHIEFDSLYTLDREKIIKSVLFKHKYRTTLPWYLFANQLQHFQYISMKHIIENALYYSNVFTKTQKLIELNSLFFAKKRYFLLLKPQDVFLEELEQDKTHILKEKFSNYFLTQLLLLNPEIGLTTATILAKKDLSDNSSVSRKSIVPYLYQDFIQSSNSSQPSHPQTTTQFLNNSFNLSVIYILDNIWNQQQKIEKPSSHHSLVYQFNRNILEFHKEEFSKQLFCLNLNFSQQEQRSQTVSSNNEGYSIKKIKQPNLQYLNTLVSIRSLNQQKEQVNTLSNQGINFTETKTLNLIDVFGNMQFVSNWKQISEISPSELEKFAHFVLILRNLLIEYHAYLSYIVYKTLFIKQKEKQQIK